jgi:hypothetical protein
MLWKSYCFERGVQVVNPKTSWEVLDGLTDHVLLAFLLQLLPNLHDRLPEPILSPLISISFSVRGIEADTPDTVCGRCLDGFSQPTYSGSFPRHTSTSSRSPVCSRSLSISGLSLPFVNL